MSGIAAAIETNEDAVTTKRADLRVTLAEIAECPTPTGTCTTGALQRTHGAGNPDGNNVVTQIRFDGFFQLGTDNTIPNGYLGNGYFVHGGGYGYDDAGGFGYGGKKVPTAQSADADGYGYGDGGLEMRYTVTINPSALANGHYWFTMIADTGSNIQDGLQSVAQSFQVTSSVGGGGGGQTGGGDDGDGITSTVTATGIDIPEGALEAWLAIVTGNEGDTIRINIPGSDRVTRIDFTLDADVENAEIRIIIWPPGIPPEGVGELMVNDPGFLVDITIDAGGEGHTVKIYVQFDETEVNDPDQAFSAKHSNPWEDVEALLLTLEDEWYKGDFTNSCCSTFAAAFDEENPTVTLTVPEDPLSGRVMLEAEADDNVELDRVEFYVGDTMIGSSGSAPYSVDWDTATVSPGSHELRAVAYDVVGNQGEDTQTSMVEETDDTTTPPGDGDGSGFPWGIVLLIIAVVAVIGGAIWYFVSQKSGGAK